MRPLTPSPSPALREALTPGPSPALREALTPGPSPALRERGDLVRELGIVKDAGAPLLRSTPPVLSPYGSGRGGRGKVRGIIPPSSPAAWERKGGWGEGEGHQACSAALAPKSPKPFSTASRRCMRCLLAFAETLYRVPLANLSKSLGF